MGSPPVPGRYLTFSYQRNLAAEDVVYQVEQSDSLEAGAWIPAAVELVDIMDLGPAERVTVRAAAPLGTSGLRQYTRLRVSLR